MRRLHICAALLASAVLTSCNGLLKEDSGDLMIPSSVSDYAAVFRGEAYPDNFNSQIGFVHLMTDDVEMGPLYYDQQQLSNTRYKGWGEGLDPKGEGGQGAFIWQRDYSENISDGFWAARYDNILACNTIIDALPDMAYDSETETGIYRALAAQAYAMRAYNYFCLVNTYAKPWSKDNLNEPGVVLRTTPDIDVDSKSRATIGEVYDLINSDIKTAQDYITGAQFDSEKLTEYKIELTPAAIYLLAARIALYQEDWDGVIEAGEKYLTKNSSITDLNSANADIFGLTWATAGSANRDNLFNCNSMSNDEVVFGFGGNSTEVPYISRKYITTTDYEFGYHSSWNGENSLIGLYDEDDLRLQAYFLRRYYSYGTRYSPAYLAGQYAPCKFRSEYNNTYTQAWRTPEVILDLAEAYTRKYGDVNSTAIGYLNQLRVKKYKTGSDKAEKQVSDFTDNAALLQFVWDERRRELCFDEIIRFWDMRRQGMPAQEHRYYSDKSTYTVYKLPQGSANYVLPIPSDETSYNDGIVNNQRELIAPSGTGTED